MPTDDVLARLEAWLRSLMQDPESAATFATSPASSLAGAGLAPADLSTANLQQAAGHLAGNSGISGSGQHALHSFAQGSGHHGSPVQQVGHLATAAHHDNPAVTNIFNQNFFDQSLHFFNDGVINGDITIDSHNQNATGHGIIATDGSTVTSASGAGSNANSGTQASGHSTVIDGSDVGSVQTDSPGGVQVGGSANGHGNGQTDSGQNNDGQSTDGQHDDGQNGDGHHDDGQNSDGQNSDGQNSDGQNSDGQNSDGHHDDGQNSDGHHDDGSAFGTGAPHPGDGADAQASDPALAGTGQHGGSAAANGAGDGSAEQQDPTFTDPHHGADPTVTDPNHIGDPDFAGEHTDSSQSVLAPHDPHLHLDQPHHDPGLDVVHG
jgi:hypothetical protein